MLREAEDMIHKGRWRGQGWFSLEKVEKLTTIVPKGRVIEKMEPDSF